LGSFRKYSDLDIIDGVRRQDNRILSYLYNSYYKMVSDYVRKNGGSDDDAGEVMQESVVSLYRQITSGEFSVKSDLKGYFFGVARNLWIAQLRHRSRLAYFEDEPADLSLNEDQYKAMLERIVARSFALLAEDCQTVLTLYGDGLSYEEIADRMGLKNAVYARRKMYLCKEALMKIIKTDPEYHDLGSL
jgi:RNA polymerase sigma factor (sigma-70 family)